MTIYQCVTEARDPFNHPVYFLTPKNATEPKSFVFDSGLRQKFPLNSVEIDVENISIEKLLRFKDDYYPLILSIETQNPELDEEDIKPSIGMQFYIKHFYLVTSITFTSQSPQKDISSLIEAEQNGIIDDMSQKHINEIKSNLSLKVLKQRYI